MGKIKRRKCKFWSLLLTIILTMGTVFQMTLFADGKKYQVDSTVAGEHPPKVLGEDGGKYDAVMPGDNIKLRPHAGEYPLTPYEVAYYDTDNTVLYSDSDARSNTEENGEWYYEFTVKNYPEDGVLDEGYFKEWNVINVSYSGGSGASIAFKAVGYVKSNIYYVLDGGTNDVANPTYYCEGKSEIELNDASKRGHRFEGWYSDSGFTNKVENISTELTGDITLYAKFSAREYNIHYNLDGGENSQENPSKYIYGTGVSEFEDAVKRGYKFEGWYSDSEFTNKIETIGTDVTEAVTLYAKFTTIETEPETEPGDVGASDTGAVLMLIVAGLCAVVVSMIYTGRKYIRKRD